MCIKRPDIKTPELVALYRSGWSLTQIGDRVGLSATSVLERLQKAGVKRRTTSKGLCLDKILPLYNSGLSANAIARQFGVMDGTILGWLHRNGIAVRSREHYLHKRGPAHHAWKGGIGIHRDGYVVVNSGPHRRRLQHRVVMEKAIGRQLKRHEHVHHLNGIRHDNRLENLAITNVHNHEPQTLVRLLRARIRELEDIIRKNSSDLIQEPSQWNK